jgi:hypothetical protein
MCVADEDVAGGPGCSKGLPGNDGMLNGCGVDRPDRGVNPKAGMLLGVGNVWQCGITKALEFSWLLLLQGGALLTLETELVHDFWFCLSECLSQSLQGASSFSF